MPTVVLVPALVWLVVLLVAAGLLLVRARDVLQRVVALDLLAVLVISVLFVAIATWVMLRLTNYPLDRVLFEVLSAYGTVGLSTGITSDLSLAAKYVIIVCMYVGRIGPMTLGAALALRSRRRVIHLPEERPVVG